MLAAGRRRPGSRLPGHRAATSPCTRSTSRPTATSRGIAASYGEEALVAPRRGSRTAVGADDDASSSAVRAQLARQPVEDLRIDFEDGYGDPPGRGGGRGASREGDRERPAGVPPFRHPVQEPRGAHSPARPAHPRPVPRRGRATAVAHAAQGHLGRAGAGDGRWPASGSRTRTGSPRLGFEIQVETPQAVLASGRNGARRPDDPRGRRARAPACTTAPTTTPRRAGHRGGAPEHGAPRRRPREGGHPGRRGRNRRLRLRRVDQRPARRRPRGRRRGELHARLVRRSLERGLYQGWDLHPAQLPTRYLATFAFFRDGLPIALDRLLALPGPAGLRLPRRAGDRRRAGRLRAARRWSAEPSTRTRSPVSRWTGSSRLTRAEPRHEPRRDQPRSPAAGAPSTAGLLPTCPRWADAVCDGRPFPDEASLLDRADQLAREFTDDELDRALAAHPRIGDRAQGTRRRPPGPARSSRACDARRRAGGGQPGLRGTVRSGVPDLRDRAHRRRRDRRGPGQARRTTRRPRPRSSRTSCARSPCCGLQKELDG